MDVRVGLWRKLSAEELMVLNCGVGEDSWESLGLQGIQPVHSKEDQSWVFIGRADAEAETPILWPPHVKSWLIWKDPDSGKDWGQEDKGMTEDEMIGWHHRLNGHGFGWTLGVGDGQGGLACCDSWGHKESDMTEWLNWTDERNQNDISRWRDIPWFWVGRINFVKITKLPNTTNRFNVILIKLPMAFSKELEQNISQFIWKHKRPE